MKKKKWSQPWLLYGTLITVVIIFYCAMIFFNRSGISTVNLLPWCLGSLVTLIYGITFFYNNKVYKKKLFHSRFINRDNRAVYFVVSELLMFGGVFVVFMYKLKIPYSEFGVLAFFGLAMILMIPVKQFQRREEKNLQTE